MISWCPVIWYPTPPPLRVDRSTTFARTVVPDHVSRLRQRGCTVVHVAAHRERLEEHLRHDDGRPKVEHDTVFEGRQGLRESAESRMLVPPIAAPSAGC